MELTFEAHFVTAPCGVSIRTGHRLLRAFTFVKHRPQILRHCLSTVSTSVTTLHEINYLHLQLIRTDQTPVHSWITTYKLKLLARGAYAKCNSNPLHPSPASFWRTRNHSEYSAMQFICWVRVYALELSARLCWLNIC